MENAMFSCDPNPVAMVGGSGLGIRMKQNQQVFSEDFCTCDPESPHKAAATKRIRHKAALAFGCFEAISVIKVSSLPWFSEPLNSPLPVSWSWVSAIHNNARETWLEYTPDQR